MIAVTSFIPSILYYDKPVLMTATFVSAVKSLERIKPVAKVAPRLIGNFYIKIIYFIKRIPGLKNLHKSLLLILILILKNLSGDFGIISFQLGLFIMRR